MAKSAARHWGAWVLQRSNVVGLKTQLQLAAAVGVSRQHLARWVSRAEPPLKMRRGLDDALARALKIDRVTLFSEWQYFAPDRVGTVRTPADQSVPWNAAFPGHDKIIERIVASCRTLAFEDLSKVARLVMELQVKRSETQQLDLESAILALEVGKHTGEWPSVAATKRPPKRR